MNMYGYQNYKQQSVNTMTQGEMLILLYDEILKRLSRAEIALAKKDYNLFEQSVQRASDIVKYLIDTLDRKYPISLELLRFYEFFLYEFTRLTAGRNPEIINDIKPLVTDLRDAFREADKINSNSVAKLGAAK